MYDREKFTQFYKGKKVFITGHTGFKGSWMCEALLLFGAEVTGYALEPPTEPALFNMLGLSRRVNSIIGDIRDTEAVMKAVSENTPDIIIHMAAQPIVRESYKDPVGTYSTNVMGTVNILEAARHTSSVKSVVNVTTDKVYKNNEWDRGYVEDDVLDGYDPYSNSKSCSELVTHSYIQSFLSEKGVAVSTCRAGNVLGGGDFAVDRIIPDCVRAAEKNEDIIIRNPYSTRPYQHVLDPIMAYLMVAMEQFEDKSKADFYNVGPDDESCVTTGQLADKFVTLWNSLSVAEKEGLCERPDKPGSRKLSWINKSDGGPHEANFLKLDCSKLKNTFGWKPGWKIDATMENVVKWYKVYLADGNVLRATDEQIEQFLDN